MLLLELWLEFDEELTIVFQKDDLIIGIADTLFGAGFADVIGGDAIGSWYENIEDRKDDYIKLTRLDTINNILECEFIVQLKKGNSTGNNNIVITEGKFSLKYEVE